jgi:hypothetical protein
MTKPKNQQKHFQRGKIAVKVANLGLDVAALKELLTGSKDKTAPHMSCEASLYGLKQQRNYPQEQQSVYFMYSEDAHCVKIGISKNPKQRLTAVQTGFPHKLEIIKTQETDDARKLERELHKALADFRLHGEWFSDDVLGLLDLT